MKKILVFVLCMLLTLTLCGCGGTQSVKENLAKAGYEVNDMDESRLTSLNNDVKYTYNGKGSIIDGFYATNDDGQSVIGVEFSDKDDMTVMYKQLKSELEDGWIIDLKGKIVIYGTEKAVKTALK